MADRYWVGGSGTWNTTSTTNWSATSGGAGGASRPAATDNVFFDQAGTYTVTMTGALNCLDFNLSAGAVTFATGTTPSLAIAGSMAITNVTPTWNSTGGITFTATTSKTITSRSTTFNCSITFNGVAGSWALQDAFTLGATNTLTLTNGTLNLNGKTLTCGLFSSSNANTRTIAFGTGNVTVNGTGTVWTTSTITNLTTTGTQVVNVSNPTATATTVTSGSLSEANSISFNFTTGTYPLTLSAGTKRNLNFTGFGGTMGNSAQTIYGNLTLAASYTAGANAWTFAATSGTKTITSNSFTMDWPVTFDGVGGTWQLQDAFTAGSTRTVTLTNGTLDLNSKTLTCGLFSSSNSNTRTIAFGTGNITVNGTGTVWTTSTVIGLTTSGTQVVNVSNATATATTVIPGALSEANSISFNFTTGTYALTMFTGSWRNINFTGWAGSATVNTETIYGNLILAASRTYTGGSYSFAATSGTKTITTAGVTVAQAITFNGSGGTWQLQDALTQDTTVATTLTNGTLDLNGKTLTVGTSFATGVGTKNLTFNAGTLVCPASTSTAFNNAQPTNFTTTAGTGTGAISMTGSGGSTFVGGGSTYNCTLQNASSGGLTISGSNTFTTISNSTQPTTFLFTSSTTQTVTNFSVSGTAGNYVSIRSTTQGTAATLSKSSGTIDRNYLIINDSTATGGATWYAGANSLNGASTTMVAGTISGTLVGYDQPSAIGFWSWEMAPVGFITLQFASDSSFGGLITWTVNGNAVSALTGLTAVSVDGVNIPVFASPFFTGTNTLVTFGTYAGFVNGGTYTLRTVGFTNGNNTGWIFTSAPVAGAGNFFSFLTN